MEQFQDISIFPRFDFKSFYKNQEFTDCEVIIEDEDSSVSIVKAHIIVLANSSQFFFNVFTGEMDESKTHQVHVKFNPMNLLPKVIEWMYDGNLFFESDEQEKEQKIPLLAIANFYTIDALSRYLFESIEKTNSPSEILKYIDQCFQFSLVNELRALEPIIAINFEMISIDMLSDALDVPTFINVCKLIGFKSNEERIKTISSFIKDYDFTGHEDEMENLSKLLDRKDPHLSALIKSLNPRWVSKKIIN